MKYFLSFFCYLLFCFFLTGQTKSGVITYQVHSRESSNIKEQNDPDFERINNSIKANAVNLSFELTFSETESRFGLIKNLSLDNQAFKARMAIMLLRGKNIFYTNINEQILIEQKSLLSKPFLVETPIDDLDWSLSKETKKIGEFLCYKAIGVKEFQSKSQEIKKTEIIVWYCPELPYRFGPFEAVGLPGLVLEFHLGDYVYSASKMNFSENKIAILKPDKGQLVSRKEFNQILSKKVSEQKRRN